jgi:outer membrane receptor protein involved in Fe transport
LFYAIAAILSSGTAASSASAADSPAADVDGIEEITVTAQRRTENLQNVPISIQALTGDTLAQLNVATLEDFVKYLPNVSTATLGPGQGNMYMRGLSIGALGTQGAGSVGEFPNVGVYLDDQSTQLPGRNLDVYSADIERIEVLEGPQGTLFGAGAQAGVIRYITNKPKLDVTEGDVNASYSTTAHGDPNSAVTAVLNLPVIADTLAVRGVIYSDTRGGYINNVPGTFTRSPGDLGIAEDFGGVVPAGSVVINNNAQVGNAINPVTYQGLRLSARYRINDDWDALLSQSYQQMNAQGVFYEMPKGSDGAALPPLSVTLFNPSFDKDHFSNTALTVNGKVGDLKLVYSGAYLARRVEQAQDYTNYARGVYAAYYQCPGAFGGAGGPCNSPSSTWQDHESNQHQSHELRLSTPDDWRLRAIGGVYWEDQTIHDDTEWEYKSIPDCAATGPTSACFLPIQPFPGGGNNNGSVRNSSTAFFDDFTRDVQQKAAFGSVDFDIIPKVLTVTGGTRYYSIDNHQTGDYSFSFGCYQYTTTKYFGPCTTADGGNFVNQPNRFTEHGFKSRGNITWHVTDDVLLYATYSQGFRPGGFNRGSGCHLKNAAGQDQWCVPYEYKSDDLTNKEVGWKTEFFGHRLQFNGAMYQENWDNVQTGIFDPQGGLGNLTVGLNGPNYRIRGVEIQLVGRVTEGLTLQGSASWNSGSLTNSPFLLVNSQGRTGGVPVGTPATPILSTPNPYGAVGTSPANSPPFQANGRARYDLAAIDNLHPYWQVGFTHTAHSYSSATAINRYDMPGWTQYEAALGVGKDNWSVEGYGQNLTDVNESVFTTAAQFVETRVPMRPRILGLRISYKFSDPK